MVCARMTLDSISLTTIEAMPWFQYLMGSIMDIHLEMKKGISFMASTTLTTINVQDHNKGHGCPKHVYQMPLLEI